MNALSIIPQHEREQFGFLPDAIKKEFHDCFAAFHAISNAPKKDDEIKRQASKFKVSPSTFYQRYLKWRNTGNWRVLFNNAKAGSKFWNAENSKTLQQNEPFVEWFCGFASRNQKRWRPQIDAFYRRWRSWLNGDATKAFPGFDVCPPDCGKGHPEGMSPRNLYRLLKLRPKAEIAMTRIGTAAAMEFLPPVPFSRNGVRPLEYIFFDDVWLDRKVVVPGYGARRLLQLGCLDLCSGVYLKFGQRPELPRDDGTRERLQYRDMKWLVAMMLEQYGYPLDYKMHLIVERATATLYHADAQSLYDLSDGQICVCYTGMEGQLVLAWREASSGKPTGKAHLESWHNLFHNECGALPGQMGKDRDHSPAALPAMEREVAALQTSEHFLTEGQRARLVYPFSDWRAAYFETADIVDRLNRRLNHDLTDFEKVALWRVNAPGLVAQQWSQSQTELEKLAPALHEFVEWNNRFETPMERLLRLSRNVRFAKIPNHILPRFYDDCHKLERVQPNGGFVFKHDDKTYKFFPPTPADALPTGNEYLLYFRPFDLGAIHITEKTNHGPRYVATWHLQDRFNPLDATAKAKAFAFKQSFVQETLKNVRRQNREVIDEREKQIQNNLLVQTEAGLVPQELLNPLCTEVETTVTKTAAALQGAVAAIDEVNEAKKQSAADEADLIRREGKSAAEAILAPQNFVHPNTTAPTNADNQADEIIGSDHGTTPEESGTQSSGEALLAAMAGK